MLSKVLLMEIVRRSTSSSAGAALCMRRRISDRRAKKHAQLSFASHLFVRRVDNVRPI